MSMVRNPVQALRCRRNTVLLGPLLVIAGFLVVAFPPENDYQKFLLSIFAFVLTFLVCEKISRHSETGGINVFDPSFFFRCVVALSLLPIALLACFGIKRTGSPWIIDDLYWFSKTIIAHIALLFSFTLTYQILCHHNTRETELESHEIWYSKLWLGIAVALLVISALVPKYISNSSFVMVPLKGMTNIAMAFGAGVILSRASSVKKARILLFVLAALFLITINLLAVDKSVRFAEKGSAFAFALGAACYADTVRWKGQLINRRWFAVTIICSLVAMAGVNLLEDFYLKGQKPSVETWAVKTTTALEAMLIENAGTVIYWVEHNDLPLQYGENYLHAMANLVPFNQQYESLSDWYTWNRSSKAFLLGNRFAVSAVAEGYLNGRMAGVCVHGCFLGLIAAGIRYFKNSRELKVYGPFFFAASFRVGYYLFRADSFGILKKLEFIILEVAILIAIFSLLRLIVNIPKNTASPSAIT